MNNPLKQALEDGQEVKMHHCSHGPSKGYSVYIFGDCYFEVIDPDLDTAIQRAADTYNLWSESQ